ncbi:MAG: flagellar biosynthesis protein FlhF [Lachnospiraceae bacterium]|nr:flagellar biosynthesis protein FlhF [Lachnospiraceae bacterium]
MTIKKFQGKTKEEAIASAKADMGPGVVIMNVKELRPKGLLGIFKSSQYEVTAAIEDDAVVPQPFTVERPELQPVRRSNFDAVADEEISLPNLGEADTLKDAFAAVNQVIEETKVEKVMPPKQETVKVVPEAVREDDSFLPLESMPFVEDVSAERSNESQAFYKMLYRVLLDNEVDEIYINQFMDDMDRVTHSTNGLDYLISNIYQKMILKLGQPDVITLTKKRPKVVFFIGPTGVGKTTTIAKIASKFKVEQEKKVALLTADTYRIAAAEQLRTYANILDTPLSIIYSPEDIGKEVEKLGDYDLILVDTAGFSHKNDAQREDMKKLLHSLPQQYESQIYLVLSSTTKYKDLQDITESYNGFCQFSLIFTKLDETGCYGNILNMKLKTGAPISYLTTGQNVPDDIEVVDTQKLVKQLLGGK